jgi:hypothetical protein
MFVDFYFLLKQVATCKYRSFFICFLGIQCEECSLKYSLPNFRNRLCKHCQNLHLYVHACCQKLLIKENSLSPV